MSAAYDVLETGEELYRSDAKMLWRRRIWSAIASRRDWLRSVAIMPGSGDQEIAVVRSMGVSPSGLHLIDHNPAVVATQRKRHPGVGGTYGVTVARAFERMAAAGVQLDATHLDFCSCLSPMMLTEIQHVVRSGVIRPGGVVAVTVLRGREGGAVKEQFDRWAEWDEIPEWDPHLIAEGQGQPCTDGWDGGPSGLAPTWRDLYRGWLIALEMAKAAGTVDDWWPVGGDHWTPFAHGAYKSAAGTQTMYWVCLQVPDMSRHHWRGSPSYTEGMLATFGALHHIHRRGWYQTPEEKQQLYERCAEWMRLTGNEPSSLMQMALMRYTIRDMLSWVRPGDFTRIYGVGPSNCEDAYEKFDRVRCLLARGGVCP